jgi:hypothetical protein
MQDLNLPAGRQACDLLCVKHLGLSAVRQNQRPQARTWKLSAQIQCLDGAGGNGQNGPIVCKRYLLGVFEVRKGRVKATAFLLRLWPLVLLPGVLLSILACRSGESTPPTTATTAAPYPTATPTSPPPTAELASWKEYTSPAYRVSLSYPTGWEKAQGYDERYEGPDGFFALSAVQAENVSLEYVCRDEAYHLLHPYGTDPKIEYPSFRGVEACLILPSNDQPLQEKSLSALIMPYPSPIWIGAYPYKYFILWADKGHILQLADHLTFVAATPTPGTGPGGIPGG